MVYIKKGHGLPRYFMFQPKYLQCIQWNYVILLLWLTMVKHVLWPWSTMIDLVSFRSQFDHGWPWSALCHLTFMVDHGQTMVTPWTNHGLPWLPSMNNHVQNMVDHGLTMVLMPGNLAGHMYIRRLWLKRPLEWSISSAEFLYLKDVH